MRNDKRTRQKGVRQIGWTNWALQAERDYSSGDSFRMTNWVGQKGGTTGWTNWARQTGWDKRARQKQWRFFQNDKRTRQKLTTNWTLQQSVTIAAEILAE
ncbi:hypothetical protein CO230_01615 [Chryseobacterium sp. 6424]|nr:hypothetical protein CO230_01615 [Chryseobacterium sp. 6424]